MASLFLSYVREDAAKARYLASLLEKAGHSVWWDRHIKGGAEYSREIESALKSAEKVVVLWSATSINSAWVRDEAAAGRDTGRLIPIMLDRTEPPLGFRQYQAVDLSDWHGRAEPTAFEELRGAIDATPRPRVGGGKRGARPGLRFSPVVALPLLILVIAALGLFIALRSGGAGTTTVVVQPATADPASRAAAQELSVKLGSMESANAGSFRLTTPAAGESRKSDLVLQVSAASGSASLSRDLTVLSGRTGAILWAGHLEQPRDKAGDLPVQLGVTAARVLSCALDALSERKPKLRHDTIKLYLTGCSQAAEEYDETSSKVALLFEKVVHQSPKFAAAWAKLLYSEAIGVDAEPSSPVVPKLRTHLEQAKRQGIETSSSYLAEAALLPSNNFLQRLDTLERGLRRYPDDATLESALGDWLMRVGRQNEAVEHARRASELDPLSPAQRMRYIWTLAHSGKPEALHELQKADRMWPGATNIELARFSLALRYGDPREALRMIEQGSSRRNQESLVTFLQARISPTKANVDRAVAAEVQVNRQIPVYISGLVTTLATFGRNDEAVQALLGYQHPEAAGYNSEGWFRAPMRGMRRDRRFMQAMARVGLASYWKRSGNWPDFCFEPDLPYDCKGEAAKYHD